ncbi:hypothetical protein MUA41_07960 [Staphylococcus simulans]|uniref:hypothetical protein n=1 Tax=Staphylococcus simulans TaxID=1286 RepID=UPI0021CED503|nr:hypothetical protein [Staphylococcus simulans]UXR34301.1 hypothetical protein MUA31_07875 [Staphylococcus simulans]UXR36968.1 hypothetical protein MUA41_07960 [Staphylococcus simulans]
MKTKEFIASVQNMGFKIAKGVSLISVKNELNETLAYVDEEYTESMSTVYRNFVRLADEEKENLFKVIVEYASTPLEKREEEKQYYIKHPGLSRAFAYLNYRRFRNEWYLSAKYEDDIAKTQFTLEELPEFVHEWLESGEVIKEEV